MTKFSDKHPKLASFLKGAGQDASAILDTVGDLSGMKAFNLAGGLIDKVEGLSTEQKAAAKDILQQDISDNEMQEQERTKRDIADDASDSWMAKNIRPLMLIYLAILCTVLCVGDSCSWWTVKELWVTMVNSAFLSAIGFYFVSRGAEKITDIKNN